MVAFLLSVLGLCRHDAMWREHRLVDGRQVMHFVCDCGRAVPVLKRTPAEQVDLAQKSPPAVARRV